VRDGNYYTAALTVRRRSEGFAVRRDVAGEATLEVGEHYARLSGAAHLLVPIGGSRLLTRLQFGLASDDLPPQRAFVLGGRGTLLGDGFRDWGGRQAALLHLEWRTPVPFIRMSAGPARTPGTITLAPYAAVGWTAEPVPMTPWRATPGTRVTVGLGAEWLGLFRLEAGYGVQTRQLHVAFDVTRDFWDIL
jgi:hemolysin activation/secretion protein